MKRLQRAVCTGIVLLGLVMLGDLLVRDPAPRAARPYEGTTIRAVVNAEYVKYSLSLVEKDVYDKLGIKIETEVIPPTRPSRVYVRLGPWDGLRVRRARTGFMKFLEGDELNSDRSNWWIPDTECVLGMLRTDPKVHIRIEALVGRS